MPSQELNNKIKIHRVIKNISQEELAIAIGVTRKTINTIETGKYIPSTVIALKIARYFQTTVEDIFELNNNKPAWTLPNFIIRFEERLYNSKKSPKNKGTRNNPDTLFFW